MSLRQDKTSQRAAMTTTALLQTWIGRLERAERDGGLDAARARARVARRLAVAPGTLENIRKARVKRVDIGLFERARLAVEAALEREARALEHEILVVRASGRPDLGDAVGEAEAALESARAALRQGRGA